MMKDFIIKLSDYGDNLGSRLLAKDIMIELSMNIQISKNIIVDFEGVSMITLSFGTEVFDTLFTLEKQFETKNEVPFVRDVINFCKANLKKKDFYPSQH